MSLLLLFSGATAGAAQWGAGSSAGVATDSGNGSLLLAGAGGTAGLSTTAAAAALLLGSGGSSAGAATVGNAVAALILGGAGPSSGVATVLADAIRLALATGPSTGASLTQADGNLILTLVGGTAGVAIVVGDAYIWTPPTVAIPSRIFVAGEEWDPVSNGTDNPRIAGNGNNLAVLGENWPKSIQIGPKLTTFVGE